MDDGRHTLGRGLVILGEDLTDAGGVVIRPLWEGRSMLMTLGRRGVGALGSFWLLSGALGCASGDSRTWEERVGSSADALLPNQSIDDAVVPTEGTPAYPFATPDDQIVWRSVWDNPVLQGPLVLDKNYQWSYRDDINWEFGFFDVLTSMTGVMNDPGTSQEIMARPFPAEEGLNVELLHWMLHGTRLGPRPTGQDSESILNVQAYRDDWNNVAKYNGPVGQIQLKSSVLLVPIRVVVLYPPPGSIYYTGADWFDEAKADLLLDDVWHDTTGITTDPAQNAYPSSAQGYWDEHYQGGSTIGAVVQPDHVFDVCEIQFRKIAFASCAVDENVFVNEVNNANCDPDLQASRIRTAIGKCEDGEGNPIVPEDGVTTLVLTGTLTASNCPTTTYGAAKVSSPYVYVSTSGLTALPYVVSHEIGHRLGLPHLFAGTGSCSGELMCPGAIEGGSFLSPGECNLARVKAVELQSMVWPSSGGKP